MKKEGKSSCLIRAVIVLLLVAILLVVLALKTFGPVGQSTRFAEIENIHPTPPPDALRVLFFGNSHTFGHSVPQQVANAVPNGQRKMWFEVQAAGGFLLQDHLDHGAEELIASNAWDVIVVQPQSLETIYWSEKFGSALRQFEHLARQRDVELIVWVPWARDPDSDAYGIYENDPQLTYESFTRSLSSAVRSHAGYAEVCPIGEAWAAVRTRLPKAPLHNPNDGNHATNIGAYLTGLVLYSCIYDRDPAEVAYVPDEITESSAVKLRRVASAAVADWSKVRDGADAGSEE